ncbi:MAG: hypothetical protein JRN23_04765 [Nitrososphaerota archaeon]|nr:hypothetical protein [Nitrososphaerota archaeon]MDG6978553.1 hypothetical protein [Nitrososphaerota archaeon]MDG7021222.1 hypothetical protein [Nitrososphaerota archaeon]MDG7022233.1 hypothetical protein [Nitrososphaerota archaeon]
MPSAGETRQPPPDLVRGEYPFWKMAEVKGRLVRHLVTGYLITNYRCFAWDVETDQVTASVPIEQAEVSVEGLVPGRRTRRGGSFIVPQTADYVPPAMGEPVETGDLEFRVKGETVMAFRGVSEPLKVKSLIEALRSHSKAHMRPPRGLGVDTVWLGRGRRPPEG